MKTKFRFIITNSVVAMIFIILSFPMCLHAQSYQCVEFFRVSAHFPKIERLTEVQITEALLHLASLGHPLNSRSIQVSRYQEDINRSLSDHMGFPLTPAKVFDHAREINPVSWRWWLRRAGLNSEELQRRSHRLQHLSLDQARVAVLTLVKNGVSVFASEILNNVLPHPSLQIVFHRDIAPKEIYLDVVRQHGVSWTSFLRQVGLPEHLVRREFDRTDHLTPLQIVQAIRFLETAGYSPNARTYQNQQAEIILPSRIIDRSISLGKIYRDATRYHQTPWEWWKQRSSKKSRSLIIVSVRQIIQVIHFLESVESSLKVRHIERDHGNDWINEQIHILTGFPLSPAKVYNQARLVHERSWESWLREAGVKVEVRPLSSAASMRRQSALQRRKEIHANYEAFLPNATGVEFSRDGERTAIAVDHRTGESELLRTEFASRLHHLEGVLSSRELFLLDGTLDFFADSLDFEIGEIQRFFLETRNTMVSTEELQALFSLLQQNTSLRALFYDDE